MAVRSNQMFDLVLCVTEGKKVQTDPPSIPIADLLPGGFAPEGEWQSYQGK